MFNKPSCIKQQLYISKLDIQCKIDIPKQFRNSQNCSRAHLSFLVFWQKKKGSTGAKGLDM